MCSVAGDRGRNLEASSFIDRYPLYRNPSYRVNRILGIGHNGAGAGQPFRLAGVSIVDGVEDEFDAGGDSELLEDAEEIFLDSVLAEVEFAGNLAVAETFGDEGHDLFLAGSEETGPAGVEHSQRRNFRDQVHQIVELFGVGPDLPSGY